jgi:hypothetical protein
VREPKGSGCASVRKEKRTNLMYPIDESLSVISTKVTDHLDLILARENSLDESDHFMWEKGTTN